MPTGGGKSTLAVGEAVIGAKRTLILTANKALQSQYASDFSELGILDIRGQSNYMCSASQPGGEFAHQFLTPVTVEYGPCKAGETCTLKMLGGCTYYDLLARAKDAPLVVANYHLQIAANRYMGGLGDFDLLVCDEAHEAPEILADALTIELSVKDLHCTGMAFNLLSSVKPESWIPWALNLLDDITPDIKYLQQNSSKLAHQRKRLFDLTRLATKLTDIINLVDNEWIVTRGHDNVKLEPVWPRRYADDFLFGTAQKRLFVSATIRPKTLDLLGIKSDLFDYFEYGSDFPADRRPIYFCPTVRLRFGMALEDELAWVRRVDKIIESRLDRKGIIHTVSFARQQLLLQYSKFAHIMIANAQGNSAFTHSAVDEFKKAPAPRILVSPSVDTGFNFPYEECEYIVCIKVPFQDSSSKVFKRRCEEDSSYGVYTACQKLIQSAGRAMRAEDDRCETFILDSAFGDTLMYNKEHLPRWFLSAVKTCDILPSPAPKLVRS